MTEHLSRTGEFARAIVRRYGEGPLMAPLLDMIVRLNPRRAQVRISRFDTQMLIAPRIGITLRNDPQPSAVRAGSPDGSGLRSEVVRRLTDRHRRLDATITGEAPDPGPARASVIVSAAGTRLPVADVGRHSGASPAPLPMTVCRPTIAAAVETGGSEPRHPGARPPQTSERPTAALARAGESSRAGAFGSANVEQLTDKVIRAIDRRIVAYRERTARG
jgi:hypothetical protein